MHDLNVNSEDILARQKQLAQENRKKLGQFKLRSYNVMGAIGSGKTALIEAINKEIGDQISIGAVAGDVAGTDDYERFTRAGITAINLNTNSECHLDPHLVGHSLQDLPLDELDVLFIENVGNLVCPADFPLGTDSDIVVISVTEGKDMVRKHPKIFAQTNLLVVNKVDISEIIGVDPQILKADYEKINPHGRVVFTSAKTGQGIDKLIDHLEL